MKFRIFPQKGIKLIMITIFLLLFISMPAYAVLWSNKVDTQDLQRIVTELRIYEDPDLPYYNEIFRLYYYDSEELLNALNNKIEITQQAMKILDADIKKEELGNLTYGRYILNAINEKELVEIGLKTGSSNQADGEYFSKLSGNLASWESQLSKFLLTKIIGATCTAIGAPALSIGISTLGLFCDLSIIKTSINKLNEVWYEKAFWSYIYFRNEPNNWDHLDAWESYAETQVKYILNLSLLSLEKQKKARDAIEENFKSLWNNYEEHIVNNKLDEDFKSQQRESLKIRLLYALGSEPHPIITSPLKITPLSPYQVGDIINAEFTIANQGKLPIKFSVLTVGGRDTDNQVADFSHRQNVILKPLESYDYKGTLTLNKVGNYHFFCTYQTPDDEWNTNVDLGPELTNEDRTEDFIVIKIVEDKIEEEIPFKTFYYKDDYAEYSVKYPNWPISIEYEEDESFGIIKSFEINHKNEMKIAIGIVKKSPETYQNIKKHNMGSPPYTTVDYFRLNLEVQHDRIGQSKKIRDFTKYDQDFLEWTIDGESYFFKPIQKQIGLTDLKLHCLSKILYCDNYNLFTVTIYVNESKWLKYKEYSKTIIDSMTIRTNNSPSLAFGTVLIDLARYELKKYEVYLDSLSNLIGVTDKYGELLLQSIPVGGHNFFSGDGQTHQYIHAGFNVVVIYVESLFTQYENVYKEGDYAKEKDLAEQAKDKALKISQEAENATSSIIKAKSIISQEKSKKVVITEAESLFTQSENAYKKGDYTKAKDLAEQARNKAIKIGKEANDAYLLINKTRSAISIDEYSYIFNTPIEPLLESFLSQSEDEYKKGNYLEAYILAERGYAIAIDVDQDGVPNKKDFIPTIKNTYIYYIGLIILFINLFYIRRKRAIAIKINNYREKLKQWEIEGYSVHKFSERWFK